MKLIFFSPRIIFLFFLPLLLLTACKQEQKPVTKEEARDFAKKLESSIEKREPGFMDEAVDKKTFIERAGLPSGKKSRDFGAGVENGMKVGTSITKAVSKKVMYRLVKQYEKNGVQHILFRLYDNGSVNYHDIELIRDGGEVKIADLFIYISGELMSETIGRMYTQMESMIGNSNTDNWLDDLTEMKQLTMNEKYSDAIAAYNKLPMTIKNVRAVQIIYLTACSMMDDPALYNTAIANYKNLYPNEANIQLLLLNGYIINKEYDLALNGINEVDKMINKDPFLDYYRYLLYTLKKDDATAKKYLEDLMKSMPDFEDGMLEMIATYLEEKNDVAANEWIEKFKLHSSFDQERLKQVVETYQK